MAEKIRELLQKAYVRIFDKIAQAKRDLKRRNPRHPDIGRRVPKCFR